MMPGRHRKLGVLGAVALLAVWIAGCSSNSAVVGVVVTGPTLSPVTVLLNGQAQFGVAVTGISTTSVFWQICLPAVSTTTLPTTCTAPQPPQQNIGAQNPLIGYGTITATGLYTAPPVIPAQNSFVIVARSTAQPTSFGIIFVNLDSGVSLQINPTTATIGPGETFQFTATVSGLPSNAVNWSVQAPISQFGSISASGLYHAPASPPSGGVTITATSTADASKTATATVTIGPGGPPVITSIDPTVAAQGSVQQDVFVNGSNLLSTSVAEFAGVPVPTTFISTTLVRATIPAGQLTQAGTFQISVVTQNGSPNAPGPVNFSIFAVRPAIVSSAPDSVTQNGASASVNLTGGFFVAGTTTATFQGAGVVPSVNNSRQMSIPVPAGPLATPGLYPIVVQNSGVAPALPSKAALNLGVTPIPGSIPTAPTVTGIAVGVSPSAVAVDEADGIAVVANSGSNSVSLISLTTHLPVGGAIAVGVNPTGVAVDDLLPDAVALVVNKTDQTVTAIDLISGNKSSPLSVRFSNGANPPLPVSIGVNPVKHRAIVAYQSTNQATVLDVSEAGGVPAVAIVQRVGGAGTTFSTGVSPEVGIDPKLNWAVITPGGAGSINLVDLGVDVSAEEPQGRAPEVIGSLSISPTVQGVAIDSETHGALFTDPATGVLSTFSLLNNTVTTVVALGGGAFVKQGYGTAAASPLENVAIAVNILDKSAVVVDLEDASILQSVSGIGTGSVLPAVAVDPVTNQAVVVNQADNAVEIVSLGNTLNPLQITESRPIVAFGGPGTGNLALTINGSGFTGGSQVQLDGTSVSVTGRQIVASVPGSMLGGARRYFVEVNNGGSAVSNVAYLTVVQAIPVGRTPVAVAVDTDRDLAVTTNSADGNVSLVSLAAPSPESPQSLGAVGVIGLPVTVGTKPEGVAVLPRQGVAVVANNGSNNASIVDLTGVRVPVTVASCAGGCTNPTAVAMNQDSGTAVVTNTNSSLNGNPGINGTVGFISNLIGAIPTVTALTVDQNPVAAAVDPSVTPGVGYAAIANAAAQSSVDFLNMSNLQFAGRASGGTLQNPSGVVFDPVNQVFVIANSLVNNVVFIDPNTFIQTSARVGINPTSLDYNFQASTLVTVNSSSHILSVLDYVCPPNILLPACAGPLVRDVLGLGGVQSSAFVLGPNAIAIDPKLNLGALVDPDNNRLLLVPLPR
jgi:DNA-binding beta-propeller fold protein YncE